MATPGSAPHRIDQPDDDALRISDADRDATAARLRTAVDEGRLTLLEYDERLRTAYAADTGGELAAATVDLPAPARAPEPHRAPAREWREWLGGAVIMIAIWATTSLVSGSLLGFWPAIPLGIWAAVLLAGALGGGGCATKRRR